MKRSIRTLFLLLVFLASSSLVAGSKYAVASGNWGATTTWSLTRGGASGAAIPVATDTVWVPSPYKVTYEASAKQCYNLIIESGAAFISPLANPTSSQVYVRITGDYVQNDGVIGYDPAKGPDSTTAIGFESYAAGKTVTFKGSGVSRISRLRGGNNLSNMTIVIDQDMTLTYTGSSGTGGVAYYASQGTGTNNTLKINAGRTLNILDQGTFANASSTDADGTTTTIQVDGSLLMTGPNSTMSLRAAAGSLFTLIVNGTVEVGRTFKPTGIAGVNSVITVNAGGKLKIGATGLGTIYFHSPTQTVTGAGTFEFAGGTLQVGATAGLDPTNGPIRTTTRTFSATGGYTFLGKNQTTGSDMPTVVDNFTVADTGTVTLTNNLTVNGTLGLNLGSLVLNGKTLSFGPASAVAYNDITSATTTTDLELPGKSVV